MKLQENTEIVSSENNPELLGAMKYLESYADSEAEKIEVMTKQIIALEEESVYLQEPQKSKLKGAVASAKTLAGKAIDAIGAYKRILVLGGLLMLDPSQTHSYVPRNESPEDQRARAKIELSVQGTTTEQKRGYRPILSNVLFRGVSPVGYNYASKIEDFLPHLMHGRDTAHGVKREDAWRLYLGLKQEANTFGISDYGPKHSKDNIYYFKINGFFKDFFGETDAREAIKHYVASISGGLTPGHIFMNDSTSGIMGTFTLAKGSDARGSYLSYYDKWDLDIPIENPDNTERALPFNADIHEGVFGHAVEIYDRLYYDPVTFEPLSPLN